MVKSKKNDSQMPVTKVRLKTKKIIMVTKISTQIIRTWN